MSDKDRDKVELEERKDRDLPGTPDRYGCEDVEHPNSETHSVPETRQLVSYDDLFSSPVPSLPLADKKGNVSSSSSSTETDSDAEGLLKTVLEPIPTDIVEYDGKSQPENGSQFLLLVKNERKIVPKVVQSKPPPGLLAETSPNLVPVVEQDVLPGSDSTIKAFFPTDSWISIVVHQFSNKYLKIKYFRDKIKSSDSDRSISLPTGVTLPEDDDYDKWFLFCFGSTFLKQVKAVPHLRRRGVATANPKLIATFFSDIGDYIHPYVLNKEMDITGDMKELTIASDETISNKEMDIITRDMKELTTASDEATTSIKTEDESHSETTLAHPLSNGDSNGNEEDGEKLEATKIEKEDDSDSDSAAPETEDVKEQLPVLSILLSMPIPLVEDLLKVHVEWLVQYGWCHVLQAKWIYALLTCLEKPISCSVTSDIRTLARFCRRTRKFVCESQIQLSKKKEEGSGDNSQNIEEDAGISAHQFKEFVNTFNLFIALAANYFQQKDLSDDC